MNAINDDLTRDLVEVATEATMRDDVRAVVIWGGEKVFAAGADIKQMAEASSHQMKAREYAQGPTAALRAAKVSVNWGGRVDLRTGLVIERETFTDLFATEDQTEGMKAFLDKRKPEFKGR